MRKLIASAVGLCLCAPALAADWREARSGSVFRDEGYRCFWVETLQATYPNWVLSPDPDYYFIPQYYPVDQLACFRDKGRIPARRGVF